MFKGKKKQPKGNVQGSATLPASNALPSSNNAPPLPARKGNAPAVNTSNVSSNNNTSNENTRNTNFPGRWRPSNQTSTHPASTVYSPPPEVPAYTPQMIKSESNDSFEVSL